VAGKLVVRHLRYRRKNSDGRVTDLPTHDPAEVLYALGLPEDTFFQPGEKLPVQMMPKLPNATANQTTTGPNYLDTWADAEQFNRAAQFIQAVGNARASLTPAAVVEQAVSLLEAELGGWACEREARFLRNPEVVEKFEPKLQHPLHPLLSQIKEAAGNVHLAYRPTLQEQLLDAWLELRQQESLKKAARQRLVSMKFTPMELAPGVRRQAEQLVEGLFVRGQTIFFGGPIKALKTFTSLDFSVSLATALPFLGRYRCPVPRRVLVLSGESGEEAIYDMLWRIARAKGLDALPAGLKVYPRLPRLGDPEGRELLRLLIRDHGAEAVVIDPVYLSFAGAGPVNWANLFEVGPLINEVVGVCRDEGCTPVFDHHTSSALKPKRKPDLRHLAFAGFAQFARQWLLLNPRQAFDYDAGLHKLWMAHGRAGGGAGCLKLDVLEGAADADGKRYRWEVSFADDAEEKETTPPTVEASHGEEAEKLETPKCGDADYVSRVIAAYQKPGDVCTYTQIRKASGLDTKRLRPLLPQLVERGVLEPVPGSKYESYRLLTPSPAQAADGGLQGAA
jgi:hypothetical protein